MARETQFDRGLLSLRAYVMRMQFIIAKAMPGKKSREKSLGEREASVRLSSALVLARASRRSGALGERNGH
jgi:hypothetical protein